ncbi:proline iminopeptidase [Halobacillus dabanensis]|uniref:Proline iminopeptidase n=1 Tax=Halobacillus dabanensis TaxID=240302 RepID=A0A1I3Q1S4_HALDA|nr:alpha/beta hydrolase [Halobacillus dabanensis]SFJ27407.1 proline iminopeptidase [Halobacillus dabanensis]
MTWSKRVLETNRGTFEFFEKGEGPPLAVTHLYSEFNESGDYFADSLIENHHVYLINLRECGGSEKASAPHQLTMLETVLDLESIRNALGFDRWKFAGHSTGGMIGILYGIYFSDSLTKLLLANTAAREYMTFSKDCIYNEGHPEFVRMQDLMATLKRGDLTDRERESYTIERTKLSLFRPQDYHMTFNKNINKKLSAKRLDFFSRELHTFDVTKKLSLIKAPTLIIAGKHDVQCPLLYSQELNEAIPHSTCIVFEQSNHYPHLEEVGKFSKVIARDFD